MTNTTPEATTTRTSDKDRLLTIGELAEALSVSVSTIRRVVREGAIPVVRLRRAVRFRFEDVLAALTRSGRTR
ncbi:MAG: hypothetical protein AMXMBFR58_36720 [Phycisphaerae bacterium]